MANADYSQVLEHAEKALHYQPGGPSTRHAQNHHAADPLRLARPVLSQAPVRWQLSPVGLPADPNHRVSFRRWQGTRDDPRQSPVVEPIPTARDGSSSPESVGAVFEVRLVLGLGHGVHVPRRLHCSIQSHGRCVQSAHQGVR